MELHHLKETLEASVLNNESAPDILSASSINIYHKFYAIMKMIYSLFGEMMQ